MSSNDNHENEEGSQRITYHFSDLLLDSQNRVDAKEPYFVEDTEGITRFTDHGADRVVAFHQSTEEEMTEMTGKYSQHLKKTTKGLDGAVEHIRDYLAFSNALQFLVLNTCYTDKTRPVAVDPDFSLKFASVADNWDQVNDKCQDALESVYRITEDPGSSYDVIEASQTKLDGAFKELWRVFRHENGEMILNKDEVKKMGSYYAAETRYWNLEDTST